MASSLPAFCTSQASLSEEMRVEVAAAGAIRYLLPLLDTKVWTSNVCSCMYLGCGLHLMYTQHWATIYAKCQVFKIRACASSSVAIWALCPSDAAQYSLVRWATVVY